MELKKYALSDVCTIVPGFAFKSNDFGSGENIEIGRASCRERV